MICKKCGNVIADDSTFCTKCGAETDRFRFQSSLSPESKQCQRQLSPAMRCPRCGEAISVGSRFCSTCGHSLEANCAAASGKKHLRLWLAAVTVCIVLAAGLFLFMQSGKGRGVPAVTEPQTESQVLASSSQEASDPENIQTEDGFASASFLFGSWYSYSGENAQYTDTTILAAEATEFHFLPTKEAKLIYYVGNTDYYVAYSGTWSPTVLSDQTARITLDLVGGASELGSYEEPNSPLNDTITVQVNQDGYLKILDAGDMSPSLLNATFEKDLLLEDWIKRELASATPSLSQNEIRTKYSDYFFWHFPDTDMVCLADVTHDGVDDMIVIHFSDEMKSQIDGYVYTIDENRQIQLIYSKTGSAFHTGGYFTWYIKETPSGCILASEEGYWSTGLGELTFHEYYLTQDGAVIDVYSTMVSSNYYGTMEEISDAFDVYAAQIQERKKDLYTLFSCPENGMDMATIANYPMSPYDTFQ